MNQYNSTNRKFKVVGPDGVTLVLDHEDFATPAMVYIKGKSDASATWDCAVDNGELMGMFPTPLTEEQINWLNGYADAVETAYASARAGMREYQ